MPQLRSGFACARQRADRIRSPAPLRPSSRRKGTERGTEERAACSATAGAQRRRGDGRGHLRRAFRGLAIRCVNNCKAAPRPNAASARPHAGEPMSPSRFIMMGRSKRARPRCPTTYAPALDCETHRLRCVWPELCDAAPSRGDHSPSVLPSSTRRIHQTLPHSSRLGHRRADSPSALQPRENRRRTQVTARFRQVRFFCTGIFDDRARCGPR